MPDSHPCPISAVKVGSERMTARPRMLDPWREKNAVRVHSEHRAEEHARASRREALSTTAAWARPDPRGWEGACWL